MHHQHECCAHQRVLHTSRVALCQSYKQIWMHNPNTVLFEMFDLFAKIYGRMLAGDHENNRTTADWHPSMGFELLVARLLRDVTFASLAELPIPNYVIVEVGIWVLHCTGLFPEENKT